MTTDVGGTHTRTHRSRAVRRALAILFLMIAGTVITPPVQAAGGDDWPAYLSGPLHQSLSTSQAITPSNVGSLAARWKFRAPGPTLSDQPKAGFSASPTVYGGRVFIGSGTGWFYALDEGTGNIDWSAFLGYVPYFTCPARGITSTATVDIDPATSKPTVYVGGGDGYLYALDAATGVQEWRSVIGLRTDSVNDYYDWSSPTVANGAVYIGVSSHCDHPFVPGAVKKYNQMTGALEGTYVTVPEGSLGGGVWTSVAVTPTAVFASTASADPGVEADAYSIIRLDASTLARESGWQVPASERVHDSDFGSSPTVFEVSGGQMVGACNKNGFYYGMDASDISAGPVWRFKVAQGAPKPSLGCLAAAIWDGTHLFVSGSTTTINGVTYTGSIRELNPATGNPVWQTGLDGVVLGSPTMNGSGVIAAPIYDHTRDPNPAGVFLLDASDGSVLRFLTSGPDFAQPVFAGGYLFTASTTNVLRAWKVP